MCKNNNNFLIISQLQKSLNPQGIQTFMIRKKLFKRWVLGYYTRVLCNHFQRNWQYQLICV